MKKGLAGKGGKHRVVRGTEKKGVEAAEEFEDAEIEEGGQGEPDEDDEEPNVAVAEPDVLGMVRRRPSTADLPAHFAQAQVVLAAITQVILEQQPQSVVNGAPSPTAYFGALMSTLDQVDKHTADTIVAILYLISMVLPKVGPAVLQTKLDAAAALFVGVVHRKAELGDGITRYGVACCGHLLRVLETKHWAQAASTAPTQLLQVLLVYSSDPRPKVRKLAQKALVDVARRLGDGGIPAQMADVIVNYCSREIAQATSKKCQVPLYLCGVLRDVLPLMPSKQASSLLEALLNLAAGSRNSVLTVQCLLVCKAMFTSANDSDKHAHLLDQLLQAMPGLAPHKEDVQASGVFLSTIAAGQARLTQLAPQQCALRLAGLAELASGYFLSSKPEVVAQAGKQFAALLKDGVSPQALQQLRGKPSAVSAVCAMLQAQFANLLFRGCWPLLLRACAALVRRSPQIEPVEGLLRTADALQPHKLSVDEGGGSQLVAAFEHLMGECLSHFGPPAVLGLLPLEAAGPAEDADLGGRWWLLPLFRKGVHNTQLGYFGSAMLPLVARLKAKQTAALQAEMFVQAKVCEQNAALIFEAFPPFCTLPTDLDVAFKPLARDLVPYLANGLPNEQLAICKGLRLLVAPKSATPQQSSQRAAAEVEGAALDAVDAVADAIRSLDEQHLARLREQMGAVASKLLPILFNIVDRTPPEKRSVVLECISGLSSVAPAADVNKLFQTALKKLLSEVAAANNETNVCEALADILHAVVAAKHSLSEENQLLLYRTAVSHLNSSSPALEKKAYRLLSVLCSRHEAFFVAHWRDLVDHLSGAQAKCQPAATKARLSCLRTVMLRVPDMLHQPDILQVLPSLVGEVILAAKEGAKTREISTSLMLELGHKLKAAALTPQTVLLSAGSAESPYPLLSEFFCMVLGGLFAQTQRMQSAAVLAISRLVYEFKEDLKAGLVTDLLTAVLLLLKEKSREVVKSVLGFCKVAVLVLEVAVLRPHLGNIIEGLTLWCEDAKNRFRQKVKGIFELLVRKFGQAELLALVPHTHTKLIEYISKQEERAKRQKADRQAEGQPQPFNKTELEELFGSDGDEDDIGAVDNKLGALKLKQAAQRGQQARGKKGKAADEAKAPKRRRQAEQQFLKDGEDGVDLLDESMVKNVVGAEPKAGPDKPAGRTKLAVGSMAIVEQEDGRIVVQSKRRALSREGQLEEEADPADETVTRGPDGQRRTKSSQPTRDLSGKAFKATKAGGDMQKGRLQPFAYLGLDPAQLNKRSGPRKGKQNFSALVKGAKKGSQVGHRVASKKASRKASRKKA